MTDDFEAIAKRMKELKLERDKPFAEPLAPDFHAELNAKLQPKPPQEASKQYLNNTYLTIEEIEAAYGSY